MTSHDLAAAVTTLHREAAALYALIGREFGLTTQQAQLLCVLTADRPSFSELATTLGCDRTNVTGMIDRLERRGLLARERDSEDRRVNRVTATQEGEQLIVRLRERFAESVADRFSRLTPEEHDRLAALATALTPGTAPNSNH
ncbi:MarR family transcriptional regulator [Streptomyces capillispiralis]|uniref:MarR family transcriptional regulator n=1 Tax=Streptomyces capillispiralis TaxID=68182 RepID=UPI0036AAB313